MLDAIGRTIDYVRISVTDRCNLRCIYCMPKDGIRLSRHEDILTYDEIVRICRIFASMGIRYIRLTGGEPLIRRDISKLVHQIKEVSGIEKVTLTTNGVFLKQQITELRNSGIDGINVSLDSLDKETYTYLTRTDALFEVLTGIDAVLDVGIQIKINCVSMKNNMSRKTLNDAERILQIAELARHRPIDVRYIELMPIGYGKDIQYLSEDEVKNILEANVGVLTKDEEIHGNGPGCYYKVKGFIGRIGFISAMSHKFCNSCNRIRLTSQGYLKTCLQYNIGTDLREMLRGGNSDEEIAEVIRQTVLKKPAGHKFEDKVVDQAECNCMSQIGG